MEYSLPEMADFLRSLIIVGVGGAAGGLLRLWVVDLLAPRWVAAVFLCNVVGSFLFALYVDLSKTPRPNFKKFHTVGLCGGLTTFSTFAFQVGGLAKGGDWLGAGCLFFGTFAACLAAAYFSGFCAKFLFCGKAGGR